MNSIRTSEPRTGHVLAIYAFLALFGATLAVWALNTLGLPYGREELGVGTALAFLQALIGFFIKRGAPLRSPESAFFRVLVLGSIKSLFFVTVLLILFLTAPLERSALAVSAMVPFILLLTAEVVIIYKAYS